MEKGNILHHYYERKGHETCARHMHHMRYFASQLECIQLAAFVPRLENREDVTRSKYSILFLLCLLYSCNI